MKYSFFAIIGAMSIFCAGGCRILSPARKILTILSVQLYTTEPVLSTGRVTT